jgi:hypothetical protein
MIRADNKLKISPAIPHQKIFVTAVKPAAEAATITKLYFS